VKAFVSGRGGKEAFFKRRVTGRWCHHRPVNRPRGLGPRLPRADSLRPPLPPRAQDFSVSNPLAKKRGGKKGGDEEDADAEAPAAGKKGKKGGGDGTFAVAQPRNKGKRGKKAGDDEVEVTVVVDDAEGDARAEMLTDALADGLAVKLGEALDEREDDGGGRTDQPLGGENHEGAAQDHGEQ
jgi:hypothetical protein